MGLSPFARYMRFSSQKRQRSSTSGVLARHLSKRRRAGPRNVPSTYSAARESIISGCSCGTTSGLQALAQALQAAPDPALDRAQRVAGQARDILVRATPDKSELQAISLMIGEQCQAALQQSRSGQPRSGIVSELIGGFSTLRKVGDEYRSRLFVAEQVDCTITRYRHHPRHRPAPCRAELAGSLPDADEYVLKRLFRKSAPPKDPCQGGEQQRRCKLVQPFQRARIGSGAAVQ